MTRLFLSGLENRFKDFNSEIIHHSRYILSSYFYLRPKTSNNQLMSIIKEYNHQDRLILDSGAFSFMNGKKITEQKLDDYCQDYVSFIRKYNIKHFVEMDIDDVFGYEKTLDYRRYIEKETNRQCLPIFHKSRGKKEFIKMVEDYDYAGIGGIAIRNIKPKEWKYFRQLNDFARSRHCKMHAMGFTPIKNLNSYGFYSSDSSSWTYAVRFATCFGFNGMQMKEIKKPPHSRIKLPGEVVNRWSWNEWCKYQRFVDR